MPAQSAPIYWFNIDNDAYTSSHSAPLLLPPITLTEANMTPSLSTATSFIKRRPAAARSPPRNRRGRARPESVHPFDSLDWISVMDTAPDASIQDIADLSQFSVGPMRRRKSSPRASPMRSSSRSSHSPGRDDAPYVLPSYLTERCTTPPPSTRPSDYSDVRFDHLMPQNLL
ncbi:hypothetical protein CPB85DRAFT_1270805 [Mucidula mucida]|nr:hypothetical protein CPB85DRAFT_1270805 [Mucidula mucida]